MLDQALEEKKFWKTHKTGCVGRCFDTDPENDINMEKKMENKEYRITLSRNDDGTINSKVIKYTHNWNNYYAEEPVEKLDEIKEIPGMRKIRIKILKRPGNYL